MEIDPFPASDFDGWAGTYDQDVLDESRFPFTGYRQALETVVELAGPRPGMRILDLGSGTGNLTAPFVAAGCEVLGTDFSAAMLDIARRKLPQARFVLHDLRHVWPVEVVGSFDRIVSAYVFHHFELDEKVRLCTHLARRLSPNGRIILADIAFATQADLDETRRRLADEWEEELYWVADASLAALHRAGLKAAFEPVSPCAGVFVVEPK